MATEKGFVAPPVSSLRKIMKPVISTDIMGNRNVEVRPVGARAEPAFYFTRVMNPEFSDAVRAAEVEEEKIKTIQEKKAARLKQFQEDVRRRVRHINKTKQKQQLENDCQAMENHLSQVRSNLRSSDCLTERKDCVVARFTPVPALHSSPPLVTGRMQEGNLEQELEGRKKAFEKHNRQVHAFTNEARKKLSHRKVESDVQETAHLPGGKWFESFDTSSRAAKITEEPSDAEDDEENRDVSTDDEDDDDDDIIIKKVSGTKHRNSSNSIKRLGHGHAEEKCGQYFSVACRSDCYPSSQDGEKKELEGRSDKESDSREAEEGEEDEEKARLQRVKFNLRATEARRPQSAAKQKTIRKKGSQQRHGNHPRPSSAPDLRAGATEIAERRRLEQQKLTYRRLYSQLERQAVRDNQRRHRQRSQILKIKREKEEFRRQEEERARRLVEPRDPMTGETSVESDLRLQMERSHLQEVLQESEGQRQKQREMARYLDALRSNLREKLSKQGQELPALCCCGDTLFDTHPDICANNCFYYKNHRAYARALQSLLTSSEIM